MKRTIRLLCLCLFVIGGISVNAQSAIKAPCKQQEKNVSVSTNQISNTKVVPKVKTEASVISSDPYLDNLKKTDVESYRKLLKNQQRIKILEGYIRKVNANPNLTAKEKSLKLKEINEEIENLK